MAYGVGSSAYAAARAWRIAMRSVMSTGLQRNVTGCGAPSGGGIGAPRPGSG